MKIIKTVEEEIYVANCHFCGERDNGSGIVIWSHKSEIGTKFYLHCSKCKAEGPRADTREEAILLWNVPFDKASWHDRLCAALSVFGAYADPKLWQQAENLFSGRHLQDVSDSKELKEYLNQHRSEKQK